MEEKWMMTRGGLRQHMPCATWDLREKPERRGPVIRITLCGLYDIEGYDFHLSDPEEMQRYPRCKTCQKAFAKLAVTEVRADKPGIKNALPD